MGQIAVSALSEETLAEVLEAMEHGRYLSHREIWLRLGKWAPVTVRNACHVLMLDHRCEGQQVKIPSGFRWEYRRLS